MKRTLVLTTLILSSLLLIFISLHNFGVIYSGLLARLLAEPSVCSREADSICYNEQYFEGTVSKGQLKVGSQELTLADIGNSTFQVGELETRVLLPTAANTEDGLFYFGLDLNAFIEQAATEDLCIKGRFLNIYKEDELSGVTMPYGAGENVLELSLCTTSTYPPSVFSQNLLNGTN